MPINLQGSGNIAEGWGPAPQLQGRDLSGMVGEILKQKRYEQALMQKNIADTIQNVREERQSAKYLEAMKAAGLVPQDYDAGGFGGAKLGMDLATRIQHQNELAAREEHYRAMEARPTGRGSRGGGSGGDGSLEPETRWDSQGREWRPGPGGRWIPVKPVGGTGVGEKPTDVAKAIKEQAGLLDTKDWHDKKIAEERAKNIEALKPDVPYSHSDVYNRTVNRLKQLEAVPGMPSTQPPGVPQRAPAETGDALPTTQPTPTAPPKGKYSVGDPIVLKDGSTHTVTAINPDGSYQVD